jgi:2-polyprenyl-3-methyl-5-hydroxy-6-metoxy-1,4-benzoquinol methylase
VVRAIPPAATVLDIGGGHGILARLALVRGAASVVVVEPDLRKVLLTVRGGQIRVVAGFDDAIAGQFDVITIVDVLYKVPLAEWDALLARVWARLRPRGMFLLKEIDPEHRVKGFVNRQQERLATAINMTLGEAFSYEAPSQLRARLERNGFVEVAASALGRWFPHAHILYTARKP